MNYLASCFFNAVIFHSKGFDFINVLVLLCMVSEHLFKFIEIQNSISVFATTRLKKSLFSKTPFP